MYKKVIILPYFGDFPKYIDLFIKSCEYNQDYDFLIISDNEMLIELPKNIKKIKTMYLADEYIGTKKYNSNDSKLELVYLGTINHIIDIKLIIKLLKKIQERNFI